MIKVIDSIIFDAEKKAYCCKSKNGRTSTFFHYQGSMDGACGVYSLVMCLRILKIISQNELDLARTNPEKSKNNLLNYLFAKRGMYPEGLTRDQIKRILHTYSSVETTLIDSVIVQDCIDERILEEIDNNRPVIIGVNWSSGGHWMACIGYEKTEDDEYITKFFFLDPGSPESKHSPWNAFVDMPVKEVGKLPHSYCGSNICPCKIDDAIIFNQ